ncbi:hypothetical protein SAMN05216548_11561 [Faunimonas pinastri]|uniref:DUF1178 family protein n=1 Tax=Faunimonas pinastri TaxID=1855383 RepID=A0A1H9NAK2_9HYPH|nr:DUF1178 family protein [Faunimonas pinastri]SER32996.1 hypothetical protein SAMN05216548_11561 [Faunimonas pinastri]
MIKFTLVCPDQHEFEGWFASSASFDEQQRAGHVTCAICGSPDVEKALMAPAVSTARKKETVRIAAHAAQQEQIVATLRKLRQQLTENSDYVGDRFAQEARKIHYEEVEQRGIYGEATLDEVKELADEGIDFHPLPILPEEQN